MARLERFELPTNWFEASYSIQLSYRRVDQKLLTKCNLISHIFKEPPSYLKSPIVTS